MPNVQPLFEVQAGDKTARVRMTFDLQFQRGDEAARERALAIAKRITRELLASTEARDSFLLHLHEELGHQLSLKSVIKG